LYLLFPVCILRMTSLAPTLPEQIAMNAPQLILDSLRSLPALRAEARPLAVRGRPGRWEFASFVLAMAGIAVAVLLLSLKLAGAEPCFQAPSGNCGENTQVRPTPRVAPAAEFEAGLLL
jgi:hypothetical protein